MACALKTTRPLICGAWLLAVLLVQLNVAAADSVWRRPVVIGASASSGFILSEPFGGTNTTKCKLNYYLDAAIQAPHESVKNLATALLFLRPEALGEKEIEAATNSNPTIVMGVDFLFWFCYGQGRTDSERAERFETGLKLLENIPCPLIVGDIPDASSATNSGIISPAQVPSETARQAANRRLLQWAANRPQVCVVALADFMKHIVAGKELYLHRHKLEVSETANLLQKDRLHPNPRGAALLSLSVLDAYVARHPELNKDVNWNWKAVSERGLNLANQSIIAAASAKKP